MKERMYETRLGVLGGVFVLAAFLLASLASVTHAQMASTTTGALGTTTGMAQVITPVITAPPTNAPAPMVANVDESGTALIRGVVQGVSGNTMQLATWGGTWNVRTTLSSTVTPAGTNGTWDTSQIMPGDFVGVEGVVAPDQQWTVNASIVRDWTKMPGTIAPTAQPTTTTGGYTSPGTTSTDTTGSTTDMTGTTTSTPGTAAGLPAGDTLYTGTASNLSGSTFTLTDQGGNTYTVSVNPDATVWDSNRNTIPLTNIQNGDTIRLDGVLSGTGITADVVRDTSL
jgi:hypothetical protein